MGLEIERKFLIQKKRIQKSLSQEKTYYSRFFEFE